VTPGLSFGSHPCNPFALVASPKLGLRHLFSMPQRMLYRKSKYILMNYYELTTIGNQIWLSIHVYVMEE
jgi:hypothetical protein